MGKFDLQVSDVRRDQGRRDSPLGATMSGLVEIGRTYAPKVMDVAKTAIDAQHEIDVIEANADAEIRRIEAEAKRIVIDARASIEKMRQENEAWHSRFDKKAEIFREVCRQIQSMNESERIREEILALARSLIDTP